MVLHVVSDARPNGTILCHIHIPKAAGTAFQQVVLSAAETHEVRLSSHEACVSRVRSVCAANARDGPKKIVSLVHLRSPRSHVLSEYMQCAYAQWGVVWQRFARRKGLTITPHQRGQSDANGSAL